MSGYIEILEAIKNELNSYGMLNSITRGTTDGIDLNKQTIFPMAHIYITQGTPNGPAIDWNVTIWILDVEDYNATNITNLDYIHNTTFDIGLRLHESFKRGDSWTAGYDLVNLTMNAIEKAYENNLAGWQLTATIQGPNKMSIC